MRMLIGSIVMTAVSLAAECPPSPAPPGPDASDAGPPVARDASAPVDASSPSATACANLAALGCTEGKAANCAATIDHVLAEHLTTVNVACLSGAKTKAAAHACGFVECR